MMDQTWTVVTTMRPDGRGQGRTISFRFQRLQMRWDQLRLGELSGSLDTDSPRDGPEELGWFLKWREADLGVHMAASGQIARVTGVDEFVARLFPEGTPAARRAADMAKSKLGNAIALITAIPLGYMPSRRMAIGDTDTGTCASPEAGDILGCAEVTIVDQLGVDGVDILLDTTVDG